MTRRLIIAGGIAAGLSAASKAKRLCPDLEVTVYEKSGFVSTGACGLPYYIGGNVREAQDLLAISQEDLRKRGISVFTGHEVLQVDHSAKSVEILDLNSGKKFTDHYDDLVLATGASPIRPPLPGIDADGVYFLRSLEDGIALRQAVLSGAKRVAIIGGGFIGLEAAEQLTEAGLQVTVVEALPRLLPSLEEGYSEKIRDELLKHGVTVTLGARVEEILTRDGKVCGLKLSDGKSVETDIILMSIGVTPNIALAERCGVKLGQKNAIVVDCHMRTSIPSIWACGDCVQSYNLVTGLPGWFPSGTTANKQGRIAGANIGGEESVFPGVLGSQVTKVFDLYTAITGLNLEKALEAGFDAKSASIVKNDKASYYPGGVDSNITLVFESNGGRILGAQALGGISIAGRINTLVAAISAGMTVSQLNDLDLLYSPSIAPVYDPLLIAATQALKQVVSL